MGFESNTGLNVSNYYGPRDSGGTRGVIKTEGHRNVFAWNLNATGIAFKFPVGPVGNIYITKVDESFVTGDVTALTIGGVSVLAATDAAPVTIASNNTGVLGQTGGTAGTILIEYKVLAG